MGVERQRRGKGRSQGHLPGFWAAGSIYRAGKDEGGGVESRFDGENQLPHMSMQVETLHRGRGHRTGRGDAGHHHRQTNDVIGEHAGSGEPRKKSRSSHPLGQGPHRSSSTFSRMVPCCEGPPERRLEQHPGPLPTRCRSTSGVATTSVSRQMSPGGEHPVENLWCRGGSQRRSQTEPVELGGKPGTVGVPDAKRGFEVGRHGQVLQRPRKGLGAATWETRVALKVAFLGREIVWGFEREAEKRGERVWWTLLMGLL